MGMSVNKNQNPKLSQDTNEDLLKSIRDSFLYRQEHLRSAQNLSTPKEQETMTLKRSSSSYSYSLGVQVGARFGQGRR